MENIGLALVLSRNVVGLHFLCIVIRGFGDIINPKWIERDTFID